jgi:hypothetical protein
MIAGEARNALGPWERDSSGRRLLSDDDIAEAARYFSGRLRMQGELPPEPPSTDPEDQA